ncbi:MAG: hypothetical protein HY700_02150, partial [Gemmatimonadetes bacterium]|nr:hypothetical protein [Gemmatimonadota bacterium]
MLRHPAALVVAVFALSCLGDSSGPNVARPGVFQLVPSFESAAPPGIVPIDRIRIVLRRPGSQTPALDTIVHITPGDTLLDLNLTVAVFTSADTFSANLALITPTGDTAFRGGPVTVIGKPSAGAGSAPPTPVEVHVVYVGTGASADSVVITVHPASVVTGDTVLFQAVAYDNDAPVPGTPVGWVSLDTARAKVPAAAVGKVVGGTQRGATRIVAQLLTGPADTASLSVQLLPAAIGVANGNNQTATVRLLLANAIVAQVKASDSLGVAGVWVKFAVQSGGGTISPDSALTDANGRASTQWTLGPTAGAQLVRATTAKLGTTQATFSATALAGLPASLAITGGDNQTATVGTAVATAPSVLVKDTDNNPVPNVPVTFAIASGDGSLTDATPLTDASGVAAVGSWSLGTVVGTNTLTATLGTAPSGPATSSRMAKDGREETGSPTGDPLSALGAIPPVIFTAIAAPGPADTLVLTGLPLTATAGTAADLTVTAKDQYGNTATGYTGAVHFTSNDPAATLPADYTFIGGDNGVRTFAGVALKIAGSRTITVTDKVNAGVTGNASTTVTAAPASRLVFTVGPSDVLAGLPIAPPVQVTALDPFGNLDLTFTGTVALSIGTNPSTGSLSGTTSVAAVAGVATFSNVIINAPGSGYTLVATSGGLSSEPSTPVTIAVNTPTKLVITAQPSGGTAGVTLASLVVQAEDDFGNTVSIYTGNVSVAIASGPAGATLAGTTTVAASSGVATFDNLSLTKAGNYTLQATSGSLISATSAAFDITPSAAALLIFTTQPPTSVAAGAAFGAQVTAKDAFGNVVTGFTANVNVVIGTNPAGGTLGGTATVSAVSGVVTFSGLSLDKAGTGYTLTASATGLTSATSNAMDVTPGTAAQLAFNVQPPSSVSAGAAFTVAVTAQDGFGNTATAFGSNVVVAIGTNPSGGTLSGTVSQPASAGVATLAGLSIDKAGSGYTLQATSGALTAATSVTFDVTPAAATQLVFSAQPPTTATAGAPFSVEVTAKDAFGNTATGFGSVVSVAILDNPAGGTLAGTTSQSATNGVATFSGLSIGTVGSRYTLQTTAGGLTSATSGQFMITPVGMTHLWTGVADTVWSNGANWLPGPGAPTLGTHNVFVPISAGRQPTVSTSATVGTVIVENGATLTLASGVTLSAAGDVQAGATIVGAGTLNLAGSARTLSGTIGNLTVSGSVSLAANAAATGRVTVTGTLDLATYALTVGGDFTVTNGLLKMQQVGAALTVTGNATFNGVTENTFLTN